MPTPIDNAAPEIDDLFSPEAIAAALAPQGEEGPPEDGAEPETPPQMRDWPEGHPRHQSADSDAPPKKNPTRFEYWQAEADRAKAAAAQEKAQREAAVAQAALLAQELERLKGVSSSAQPLQAAPPPEPALEKPAEPVRPQSYNDEEAYSDPKSESWKFREARERYRDALVEYSLKQQETVQQRIAQEEQIGRMRMQTQKLQAELQAKYGFSGQEAVEFLDVMSKPESLSLDNLVGLFRVTKGKSVQGNLQDRTQQILKRNERLGIPSPQGGSEDGAPQLSEEDGFNAGFIEARKRRQ